jgi:hypothetical protein
VDSQGRQLEVLELQGADKKFKVKNLGTGRTLRRGARALANLIREAPPQAPPPPAPAQAAPPRRKKPKRPLTPAQIAAGFGGKRAQARRGYAPPPPHPEPIYEEYPGLEDPEQHQFPPQGYPGYDYGSTTGQAPVSMPYREEYPSSGYTAPPPRPVAPHPSQPGVPPELADVIQHASPSELVAYLVLNLLSIPPHQASNTILIDKVFARAKTEWKTRTRGW